jgi:molybdopterin-guanine dinucleotide biosynthesis protein A
VIAIEAFILAGGASSRMGREKALVELAGEPLALRLANLAGPLAEQVTLVGPPQSFVELPLRVLADDVPGLGPLGGIATALRVSRQEWNLVLGCDLPFLTAEWLQYLITRAASSSAQAVLPDGERGHREPLCAMYHRSSFSHIAAALGRGARKVTDGLAGLRIEPIPAGEWKRFDSEGLLFKNMNTPEDYEEVRMLMEKDYKRVW